MNPPQTITIKDVELAVEKIEARLLEQIEPNPDTDCWVWQGNKNAKGYGRLSYYRSGKTRYLLAHRVSYALRYRQDPGSMCVCHTCDNPACVNPEHLFLGTVGDNNRDAFKKGRNKTVGEYPKKGVNNPIARYTEAQIKEMRRLYNDGATVRDLVAKFGGSRGGIYAIVNYINWAHIPDDISSA
jgi:hypothetical protein